MTNLRTRAPLIALCIVAALTTVLSGCGGEDNPVPTPTVNPNPNPNPSNTNQPPLLVTSLAPAEHAIDVDATTLVKATFTAPVNAASVSSTAFALMDEVGTPVTASVTYDVATQTATLAPLLPLQYGKLYTAHIQDVTSPSGSQTMTPRQWNFRVQAEPLPRESIEVGPSNGITGISTKAFAYAHFSEPLDVSTLTAASLTLTDSSGAQVPGSAHLRGDHSVAFTPMTELNTNTVYTAKLAKGLTVIGGSALAQDLTWQFTTAGTRTATVQIGDGGDDSLNGIVTDDQGNTYVTGATDTFDPLTGEPRTDLLVTKLSPENRVLWQEAFGERQTHTVGVGIAVDNQRDVIVVGDVVNVADQGPPTGDDMVALKISGANGSQIWRKVYGSAGVDSAMGVAVDSTGNIYLAAIVDAAFQGKTPLGGIDAVVARLANADGSVAWATQFGGTGDDVIHSILLDSTNTIYVAGRTTGTVGTQINQGLMDILVAKLDSNTGTLGTTRMLGTTGEEVALDIALVGTNVVIGGWTDGALQTGVVPAGIVDTFLIGLDTNLTAPVWTKQAGGEGFDSVFALASDKASAVYTVELSDSPDPLRPGETVGAVVRKVSATDGSELWKNSLTSRRTSSNALPAPETHVEANEVAVGTSGNVFVAGTLHNGGELDGNVSLPEDNDGFVVSYTAAGIKR